MVAHTNTKIDNYVILKRLRYQKLTYHLLKGTVAPLGRILGHVFTETFFLKMT